ncbi:MAG TPA: amidohydrolase family protein [Steroidobacteraceae bacterium]|nr:amidohydrolase family protein [Steroidobacteraceae bacterium]
MRFLSDADLDKLAPADSATPATPIPTQVVSNGEFTPLPQSEDQRRVEARIAALAEDYGRRHGLSRRKFLASSAGMAAAFIALNEVFGPTFSVAAAEAATPGAADERARALANQFIIDVQTHFVRDDYRNEVLIGLAAFAKQHWNPALAGNESLTRFKFENYIKEIYVDSDTKVALISGTPTDDPANFFLTNDQIEAARAAVNGIAGSRRLLSHSIITPGSAGWLEEVDRCIDVVKPDSWKGYTIGDPVFQTKRHSNWRMDDERLVYPWYEKALKAGITTICVHKGLMPADYQTSWPDLWQYSSVWDVGKAAKDWPQLKFVIYHSALRPFIELPDAELDHFDKTGRIDWVTDLAEIPAKFGVTNVYAELGTSFANSCITHPRLAAALLGTVIRDMGLDHVLWGTDSVWYGSPQWQIEALRRLEIPQDMQKKHGFAPLGSANGVVKNAIFAGNAARLYSLDVNVVANSLSSDQLGAMKQEYARLGAERSNLRYGYVARAGADPMSGRT